MKLFPSANRATPFLVTFGALALLGFTGCAQQPPPQDISCNCNCGGPPPGGPGMQGRRGGQGADGQQRRVPKEFFEVCKEKTAGDACSVSLRDETIAGKCAVAPTRGPKDGKKGGPDGKKGGPDAKKGGPDDKAKSADRESREPKLMCWPDQPVAFGASDGRDGRGGKKGGKGKRPGGPGGPGGPGEGPDAPEAD